MNGVQDEGGAFLETQTLFPGEVRDFSKFSELVFDVQLVPGNPTLPNNATLFVELGCSTVSAADGSLPGNLYLVQDASYSSGWSTVPLDISGFASPTWVKAKIQGGAEACLERVDSIEFSVDAQLPDGTGPGMGTTCLRRHLFCSRSQIMSGSEERQIPRVDGSAAAQGARSPARAGRPRSMAP